MVNRNKNPVAHTQYTKEKESKYITEKKNYETTSEDSKRKIVTNYNIATKQLPKWQ